MVFFPETPEAGRVVVFVTSWCPHCRRLRGGLDARDVAYDVVDVDSDGDAAAFVESVNGGNRVVPTVLFADGQTATNPEPDAVVARLSA